MIAVVVDVVAKASYLAGVVGVGVIPRDNIGAANGKPAHAAGAVHIVFRC